MRYRVFGAGSLAMSLPNDPNQLPAPDPADGSPDLSRRAFVGGSAAWCAALASDGLAGARALFTPMEAATPTQANRSKPLPLAYKSLPLGSVRAKGWLLRQLELQRDGLTGHAEEVLPATAPNSAWKGGDGEDWEKGPYYVKGLIPLAHTLGDETLKKRAAAWIEPILASQREDGFFGPKKNDDWWPRMVVTYLLRDHHEATGDPRVPPFLTRYYRHMLANLPGRPLRDWGRARAGDEIDTVLWLHERTGDAFLLDLTDLLAKQAYPWRDIFTENRFLEYADDFHPKHNVNVPQALKMPVVYSRRSGDGRDREAYRIGLTHLMRDHGTPFGINSGSEMVSGRSSTAGVETCSIVEYMLSAETAMRVLGEARIGDEIELVAFNGLPAALSKDIRQHVYYTLPNSVAAVRGVVGYQDDHGNDLVPAPISGYPCCCYNLHMGWPKLAQNAWGTTEDGGLAALVYVPSEVTTKVAGDTPLTLLCETDYPFEETIRLQIRLPREAKFPLRLRVPGWCKSPQITVNGKPHGGVHQGTFAVLDRTWKDGDRVELTFPMHVEAVPGVAGAVSVRCGPLVYALGLREDWKPFERKEGGFDSYEVTSASAWNYALLLDEKDPAKSLQFVAGIRAVNPFETGKAPVSIRARGKRLEPWQPRFDGRVPLEPPASPVASSAPEEPLTLVPFGSQLLRVSVFPVTGSPIPSPSEWKDDFSGDFTRRWLVFRGATVKEGRVHLPHAAKAVSARAHFANFTYEADVAVGAKGDAGVMFRVAEPSVGPDHYRGYYVGISSERQRMVFGKSDNAWNEIAARPLTVRAGEPHRVRIEAVGTKITVWIGDMEKPLLEIEDASFTAGSLGVRSYSDRASFGNLAAKAR